MSFASLNRQARQDTRESEELDTTIRDALVAADVDLVFLAGYVKRLGPLVLAAFTSRILNTHPALLPKFGGPGMYGDHVFQAVLEAGETESGVSIHLVDSEYDTGPIVRQCTVPVLPGDSLDDLKARVRVRERAFVVETLSAIATGQVNPSAAKANSRPTIEPMTTEHDYADWLARYRRAWIERDADAAGRLFTDDAIYREQPFQSPFVGRAAIRDYWSTVTASQTGVELRYGRSLVDGRRLAVEWWANLQTNDGSLTLAGEFLLLFAETGECRELREYWVLTQGRVEPPPGWGE